MRIGRIIFACLLLSLNVMGQRGLVTPTFCKIACLSGEIRLDGLYRQQTITRPYLKDTAQSSLFSGSILLNANTYFWHPNFLTLDVGVEYSPEQRKDNYGITIPDQGETRTLKKLDLRTTLFQKKVISATAFYNISQTYNIRDYADTFRTNANNFGAVLYLRSRVLPLSVSYQHGKITQSLIDSSRLFNYENSSLEGRISKSFGDRDRHELILSHNEFKRIEKELPSVQNNLDDLTLNNEIFFDKKRKHRFYSTIIAADQTGYDTITRLQAYENVSFKLPAHFELLGNFNYHDLQRNVYEMNQQVYRGVLRHKLFESLNSSVYYEHTVTGETGFDQTDKRRGIDLSYEKKIPKGVLYLSYSLLLQNQEKTGDASSIKVFQEPYLLKTGTFVRLKRPYVNINSVVVRDSTGTILYQINLDYLLIEHGNFIEIVRVPGGQIADNSLVFIDYTALIPADYQYDMTNQAWTASVTLWNRLVNVYYRNVQQDFSNLTQTDFLTLNVIRQQVYGLRMEYKAFNGGIEYDDNGKSSLLPYELTRYFVNFQTQFKSRFLVAINANYNDYHLVAEDIYQRFTDVSGQLAYTLKAESKVNFELGYRQQQGSGIDLDLLNARLEYSTKIRMIYLTLGVQTFHRKYLKDEIDNYNGAYFRISRRF